MPYIKLKNEKSITTIEELYESLLQLRNFTEEEISNSKHPSEYIETLFEKEYFQIQKAVEIIKEHLYDKKLIIIHGDYDADGQTATAILQRTIRDDLGKKNVIAYIPNRFDEGYGLSTESIDGMEKRTIQEGFTPNQTLIITVDCGIVSPSEAKILKEKGFTVIITDHHSKTDKIPEVDAIVWTDKATGAGIAWTISNNLITSKFPHEKNKYSDLAAIGTICDLQPLTDFNRSISKMGLLGLNTNSNLGIKKLLEVAGVKFPIDTYEIGWVIGPRLNATGRLENAMDSLNLLISDDPTDALRISKELNLLNQTRQDKTFAGFEMASKKIGENNIPNFIISSDENYHEGIIGLIAGRLTQKFNHPAIAISIDKNSGLAKGSARSITGISIVDSLREVETLFEKVGGHEMAAGLTIKTANNEKLNEFLNKTLKIDLSIFDKKIEADLELPSSLISLSAYEKIQRLKPFGTGNPEPTFLTKNLKVFNKIVFGKENTHLKLFLLDENQNEFTALGFGRSYMSNKINIGESIDLCYNFSLNEWNGNRNLELKIREILSN